jgi:flagella basal body P-ring formation protein FlgA
MRWRFWKPPAVEDLPFTSREAAIELERLGLLRSAALWHALAPNWTFDPLLEDINDRRRDLHKTLLTRAQLAEAVAFIAAQDAPRFETPIAKRISHTLVVLFVPVLLIAAWRHASIGQPLRDQVVVTAPHGVRAYHVIAAEDVTLKPAAIDPQAILTMEKVVGRVATRALPVDHVVHADQLSAASAPADLTLATRDIVSIPVRNTDAAISVSLPAPVTLLFSEKTGAAHERQAAYLLALVRDGTGSVATVAVPAGALDTIQPLLSARDVTIVWPAPR